MTVVALADAAATEALGAALARSLGAGVIYLRGELGAGKTTLARGLLRQRGVTGPVRSPTYTLMEPYQTAGGPVFHLDLYRLADPEELHFLGIDEIAGAGALALIEWPERGGDLLPAPDVTIELTHDGGARQARLAAGSERGREALRAASAAGGG